MILITGHKYDGLRPMIVDNNKVRKIGGSGNISSTIKSYLKSQYNLINPRDWMFTEESDFDKNDYSLIFYPKITDSKISKINCDLGVERRTL